MRGKLAFGLLVVFALSILISGISSVVFATSNDTMDVNITIGSYSEITVLPAVLNWTDVQLGQVAGNRSVSIENTGSVNVTQLYVYGDALTDEVARPYGSSNASNYSAASVITVNNARGAEFYFVGRIEWNWTENIQNMNTTNINSLMATGFYKNVTSEYVWAIGNGTGGVCNASDAQFAIEDDMDSGTMDTRTPLTNSVTNNGADANYSYYSVTGGTSPLNGYCVAVSGNCNKTYIYKYDKRGAPSGFGTCGNSEYITTANLVPGTKYQIDVNAYIPRGIPAGEMIRATMTFVAI
jgi:hypothetical protein